MTPDGWLLAQFDAASRPEREYQRRPMFEVLDDHDAEECSRFCAMPSSYGAARCNPSPDETETSPL